MAAKDEGPLRLRWLWHAASRACRQALRAYYFTSFVGSDDDRTKAADALWDAGFTPAVFKRPKNSGRSKGVDIALATEMLSNAFRDNHEIAVLVAGDGDYVPLVEAVKRLGMAVYIWWLDNGVLSPALKRASDGFEDFSRMFDPL